MSEVRPQLLITVVHGTWPRGLFPKIVRFKQWVRGLMRRKRLGPPPFWFEEGGSFLDRLSTELGDIPHKITPLLWSGANSIFVRDKTAHVLAEHLSGEHAEHPQATQLVIAHSHGGNIALRALHHLRQRDASRLCGIESSNPLVVTLATPFIEVHKADFGARPRLIRSALAASMLIPVLLLGGLGASRFSDLFEPESAYGIAALIIIFAAAFLVVCCVWPFISWWWITKRATARQNQVEALRVSARLGEVVSAQAQRLLIIRAIDDEASLILAFGTIVNYVTARLISFIFLIWVVLGTAAFILNLITILSPWAFSYYGALSHAETVALGGFAALTIMLFGLLMVSRSVHGRELAVSPMECQINTQPTPDAVGLSKIVTLVRRTYIKSLRHGIYDHEDCPKAISDWVRSQLYALPAR